MSVTYPYTMADFPNGLRSDQLQKTIEADPIITVPIIRIDTDGDDVYIVFSGSLSTPEEDELDILVANHVPNNQSTLAGTIWQEDIVSTTDATLTTLTTISTSSNTVIYVQATVIAIEDTTTNNGGWLLNRTYKNSGGSLSVVGGQDKLTFRESDWDTSLTTSGTDIIITIQGEIATNVSWKATTSYSVHSF